MRFGIREAIFVLLLLGVPVAAYFIVFKQRNEDTVAMREEITRDKAKLARLEVSGMKEDLDEEIAQLAKAVADFEEKLPAQREVEGVLKEVTELAAKHRLTVKSFRTDKVEKKRQYSQMDTKLSIVGDFDGFYLFLQELEGLQRITRLPVMELQKDTRSEVEGAMSAELTLTIYFEGESHAAASAAQSRSRS